MAAIKILLVDDELDFLEVMGQRIRSWGYDLMPVSGGKEALEAVTGKKADLVILDYMMPEMDGLTTLKEIRRIDKKIPVIMFTAHPDMKVIKGTEKFNVNAFIPKMSLYTDSSVSLRTAVDMVVRKLHGREKKE